MSPVSTFISIASFRALKADGSTVDVGAPLRDMQAGKAACAPGQEHMYPLGDGRGGLLMRRRWRGGSPRAQHVQHIGGYRLLLADRRSYRTTACYTVAGQDASCFSGRVYFLLRLRGGQSDKLLLDEPDLSHKIPCAASRLREHLPASAQAASTGEPGSWEPINPHKVGAWPRQSSPLRGARSDWSVCPQPVVAFTLNTASFFHLHMIPCNPRIVDFPYCIDRFMVWFVCFRFLP